MRTFLLALGDIDPALDSAEVQRVRDFVRQFATELDRLSDIALLFSGRKGTLAAEMLEQLENRIGHAPLAERVATYLPEDLNLAEVPPDDFVRFGKVINTGRLIEHRREAMVRDCDAVLLMGTGRGIYDLASLASQYARFVIPIPIAGGPAITAYAQLVRFSARSNRPLPQFATLGNTRATGPEIARALVELIGQFSEGKVGKSQVFLAMPFVPSFREREGAERAVTRVCQKHNCTLYVAKDTNGERPLITEILYQIDHSALVVACLDEARANVYLELGYAWGKGKPVALCIKSGSDAAFDVSAHEQLRWTSIKNLEQHLDRRFKKLIDERLLVA